MGLMGAIFGKSDTSSQEALLAEERRIADEEKLKADELALAQKEERTALSRRRLNMQGGGRQGLMFGGSQRGVA